MNNQILETIRKEFTFIGEEKISGLTALKIINDIVEELTIPKEVELAQKYIMECNRDMGFMGSPEYDRQKKIVDDYFEPIKRKQKEKEELEAYTQLKSKYDHIVGNCDYCKNKRYIGVSTGPCVMPEPCLSETGKKNWVKENGTKS
jgi:hypothetical protein